MYNNYYPQYQPQPPYQQAIPQQTFSLPTIRAEIIQINSKADAERYGVAPGSTQMFVMADDSAILTKTAFPNGSYTITEYLKKEPEPVEMPDYITRAEVEKLIAELKKESVTDDEHIRGISKQQSAD